MSKHKNLIASLGADDRAAAECGAIVMWDAASSVSRAALAQAWADAGLAANLLPPDKSPEVALREAVDGACTARRFRRRAPGGGWVVVNESASGEALNWAEGARCTLDRVGRLAVTFGGAPAVSAADQQLATELAAAYDRHLNDLDGATVTGWLVGLARGLSAVGLKDTGGVYFVPRSGLAAWRAMGSVAAKVAGVRLHEIVAVLVDEHAERTVAAILAAVAREADQEASAMLAELSSTDPLGARALATRAKRCASLRAKVSDYGEMLGANMTELLGRLETLSAAVAAAALAAEAA